MAMLLLLLLVPLPIFIVFIFLLTIQHKSRRTRHGPPGPKGLPFIGNLHQLHLSKIHAWLAQQSAKYGPITLFKICRLPVIVISSADAAKHVYKYNDVAFAGRPYSSAWFRFSYELNDIIGSPYTDYWRNVRRVVVHHLFNPQKIRSFRPVMEDEVSSMIAEISKKANSNEVIDIQEMALSFTCSLLCRVAFGKKFDQGTGPWTRLNRIVDQFQASVAETFLIDNFLFGWVNWISGGNRRTEKVFEELDSFYQQFIDEHLSPDRPDCMKNDILDLLIQLRDDESAPVKIDWKHIKAILMNIYLSGTDTSGVTITWAVTALMKKPRAMKKVQQEIRGVVGMKRSVHEDDIEKLPYLRAVVKETMRLYPGVPLIPKETIEKSTINGYEIEPKTVVFMHIWGIGRDPEYWENPDEFLPERFLHSSIDFVGQDHFGFIPFGLGRRMCPGMQLAVATVELALANILHLFNWELPHGVAEDDIDVDHTLGLVMHKKNPLYLIAKTYI